MIKMCLLLIYKETKKNCALIEVAPLFIKHLKGDLNETISYRIMSKKWAEYFVN